MIRFPWAASAVAVSAAALSAGLAAAQDRAPMAETPAPGAEAPASAIADDGGEAVLLSPIDVDALQPPPAQPRAEIGRAALARTPLRSVGDALADTPGVTAVDDRRNPGVAVEVRGLRDRGRVTTTIDGARQNFQQAGHGSSSLAYVDSNLLRAIEVEKSVTAGVGGAGALAGSVGFRTIEPDDVIPAGDDWGAQGRIGAGDNAYRFDGFAAGAWRPNARVAALLAISRKELGDYAIGEAGRVETSPTSFVPTADPVSQTGSEEVSALAKAVISLTPAADLTLSYLDYRAQFQTSAAGAVDDQDTTNRTATARLDWAPANSIHEVETTLYWNGVENRQDRAPRASYGGFKLDYALDTFGGSISDTMGFETRFGVLELTAGGEAFGDETSTASVAEDPTDDPDDVWFSGANPEGERQVGGLFARAALAPADWLRLRGGLRLDGYRLEGTASVYGWRRGTAGYSDLPVSQSDWRLVPSVGVSVLPARGWEVFADYTEGWRPPTLSESVFGGSHIGFLQPFAPNPGLRPETARMLESGVAFEERALLRDDDRLRVRASVYARDVSDYITSQEVLRRAPGFGDLRYIAYVNIDGTTRFRGAELEAAYSIGRFDLGLGLEALDVNLDGTFDERPWNGRPDPKAVAAAPSSPPSFQASVTAQARLLGDRLTLGGRMRLAGDSTDSLSAYRLDGFMTFDAWASLAITETAAVRLSAVNLTDQAYVDPNGSTAYPAPGRTLALSLEARF
ncbi:TonB-dependent receptor domain-containing protein [Albimonas pacifica]|uniref:Hemoglobin/transferrin/lactoferrin receptor protein/heme acquisition protein HasR n=1 Tax=Albimonas pacifica TaxID=1114924 RepID=A0A1I3BW03_9RHOB|nr:TonB-dependent receptor [Albimonas pacifica]SFH66465.1 hemoglobin/transferrin/lactoferrin receptor protein/heme acquisition protein HasR [Albimonas pacifica]